MSAQVIDFHSHPHVKLTRAMDELSEACAGAGGSLDLGRSIAMNMVARMSRAPATLLTHQQYYAQLISIGVSTGNAEFIVHKYLGKLYPPEPTPTAS